jgi:hypothetical protein
MFKAEVQSHYFASGKQLFLHRLLKRNVFSPSHGLGTLVKNHFDHM